MFRHTISDILVSHIGHKGRKAHKEKSALVAAVLVVLESIASNDLV